MDEISLLLRLLFKPPEFKTKRARMGKVVLVSPRVIQYYGAAKGLIHIFSVGPPPRNNEVAGTNRF
jgi:hypothetical protein